MAGPVADQAGRDRVVAGFGRCPCGLAAGAERPAAAWRDPLSACCDWRGFALPGGLDAAAATALLQAQPALCGYVLTAACGCGMAAALVRGTLPVATVERLSSPAEQESFAARAFAYRRWRRLCAEGISRASLQDFHARHKYLVMSRHPPTYRQLGRLLAAPDLAVEIQAQRAIGLIMAALRRPATRAGQTNALQHIQGHLKRRLDPAARADLGAAIAAYRAGGAPLLAPLALLRQHFRRHPDSYIEAQVFLHPHPGQLELLDRC